jgi:uncharacterized membrane protein
VAPRQFSADRVRFFSEGVFAVLITILVLAHLLSVSLIPFATE